MKDRLKKFISDHKSEFDGAEPSVDLWKKIDTKMDANDPSKISSNWLLKFKYLGFSASILIVTIYVIGMNMNGSSVGTNKTKNENVIKKAERSSAVNVIQKTNMIEDPAKEKMIDAGIKNKNKVNTVSDDVESSQPDSSLRSGEDPKSAAGISAEKEIMSDTSKVENGESGKMHVKRGKLFIPVEPEEANTFSGTLYDGTWFCALLRAYKFPGKVGLDMGKMTTTSCSRLARIPNMKAIWLKGKTDKKIMFSLKDKFSSIQLVKKSGKKFSPEAVSHYYPGLLVISAYEGKFFNMAFEDNVGLILFFKDAEEGDKLVIDGAIEADVKDQP
jgi:hypothetical protein